MRGGSPVDPEVKSSVKVPSLPPMGCWSGGSSCIEATAAMSMGWAVIEMGWVAAVMGCVVVAMGWVVTADKACTASIKNDTVTNSSTWSMSIYGEERCAGVGRRENPAVIASIGIVTVTAER